MRSSRSSNFGPGYFSNLEISKEFSFWKYFFGSTAGDRSAEVFRGLRNNNNDNNDNDNRDNDNGSNSSSI